MFDASAQVGVVVEEGVGDAGFALDGLEGDRFAAFDQARMACSAARVFALGLGLRGGGEGGDAALARCRSWVRPSVAGGVEGAAGLARLGQAARSRRLGRRVRGWSAVRRAAGSGRACSARRWASQTLSSGMGRPWRCWNAVVVRSIRSVVSASWRRRAVWWVWSVTNTEQVRQALPLSQVCSGGSRHQPLGRNRSARSNRCRLSWSSRENWTRVPSALSLAVARNACSACSSRCGDVVHRHRRGGVPGVALQDVDGQAELGEPGQLGVPEPVGVAQLHRLGPWLSVICDEVAELAQHPVVGARWVGLVAACGCRCAARTGTAARRRGTASWTHRCCSSMTCGDLAVDEDGVRCDVDLALGVAEPGDCSRRRRSSRSGVGRGGEAVEVAGADLAGAAAGEDLQQDHPHRLRVVEARRR